MKKSVLALLAIVCTIVLSSFTAEKFGNVYMIFDGSGAEDEFSNYSQSTTAQSTDPDAVELWWFRVSDADNTVIRDEFEVYFDVRDTDDDGSLSDENEIAGTLEKKESF